MDVDVHAHQNTYTSRGVPKQKYASKHTRTSNEHSEIELPTYSQPISKLITDC